MDDQTRINRFLAELWNMPIVALRAMHMAWSSPQNDKDNERIQSQVLQGLQQELQKRGEDGR